VENTAPLQGGTERTGGARAAGVTGKLWSIKDVVKLIETRESETKAAKTSH
jgi:hypothetical protein